MVAECLLSFVDRSHTEALLELAGQRLRIASNAPRMVHGIQEFFAGFALPSRVHLGCDSDPSLPLLAILVDKNIAIGLGGVGQGQVRHRICGAVDDGWLGFGVEKVHGQPVHFLVRRRDEVMVIVVPDCSPAALLVVGRMVRARATVGLLEMGFIPLHGSCVALNGAAVALIGRKGVGKTTLMLQMMEAGCDIMANDRVFANVGGRMVALPQAAGISRTTVAMFDALSVLEGHPERFHLENGSDASAKLLMWPADIAVAFGRRLVPSADICAMVFIEKESQADCSRLWRLGEIDGIRHLEREYQGDWFPHRGYWGTLLRKRRSELRSEHSQVMMALARTVPSFRLMLSSQTSATVVRLLMRHVAAGAKATWSERRLVSRRTESVVER